MRLAIRVICFGLASGLIGLALLLIVWGVQIEQGATASGNGFAMGALYAAAAYRVALGCAALIGAGLLGGAGIAAQP